MNNKFYFITTISFLLLFNNILFAQKGNIEIVYEQAIEKKDGKYRVLKGLEYSLIANKNESIFKRMETMDNDAFRSNERFIYSIGGNGIYYTNNKDIFHQFEFKNETFLVMLDKSNGIWKVLTESKMISGYKCYKAIYTHTKYIEKLKKTLSIDTYAWFTPDISIPFGPTMFGGLPGLILQIKPYGGKMYFTAKSIKGTKKTINQPIDGKLMTEKELEGLFKFKT